MKEYFFNYKENEIIQFFQFCHRNQKDYYPKKTIQEALAISEYRYKAILQNVEEINAQYPTFRFSYDKHGLSISFTQEFLLFKVYILLFKQTVGYKFLLAIYKDEFQNLDRFADSVHMHPQSVLNKLKPIRTLLKNHSLVYSLFTKKIIGEEYRIRHFFFKLFWHIYDEEDPIFPEYPESIQAMTNMINTYLPTHSREDMRKLYLFMKITYHRLKKGYMVTELPQTINEIQNPLITFDKFKVQLQTKQIATIFFPRPLNEQEYAYLYYIYTIVLTYTCSEEEEHAAPVLPTFYSEEYQLIEQSILSSLHQQINCKLTEPQKNFISINTIFRITYFLSFGNEDYVSPYTDLEYFYFGDPTKDHYLKIVDTIIDQLPLTEQKWQRVFQSDPFRFSLFQVMTWVLDQSLDSIKVCILTKYGKIHKTGLVRLLENISPRPIEFVEYNQSPEIIFCDFPLKEAKALNPTAEIFLIAVNPTPMQWVEIVNFVEATRTKNQFSHLF